MAELEVDQSNLPKVQDVCQCFAVLEDGVLAHSLQEQEIEQYYSSNVQRNQLVQRDIRVAKRLQDEEERRRQMLQHQATRQLEERDSEYARMIQEDIQRRAEEARMREVEDEEIAKRIQEEEELCMRRRGSYQNRDDRETPHVPPPPYSHRPVHTPHTEDQYYIRSSTRRWQHPPSPTYSDSEEDLIEHNRPRAQTNRTQTYQDFRPNVGQRNVVCYSTTPRAHLEQDCRSTTSQSSSAVSQTSRTSHLSGGWGGVIQLIKNDMSEQGYLDHCSEDELFEPVYKLERILRQKQEVSDQRSSRGGRLSRHSSVREELSRTWQGEVSGRRESFKGNDRERRVHFLDERRRPNSYHGNGYRVHENGHSDARERGEVAGLLTAALYRDNNVHSRVGQAGQPQTQDQGFRRNISMRRSYHGDVRLNKRASVREGSRTCSQDDSNLVNGARPSNNTRLLESRVPQVMEEEDDGRGRLREAGRWEMEVRGRGRSQRQRTRSLTEEERRLDRDFRRYRGEHRVRRSQSERWQSFEEEEEEVESRREERWMQRLPSPRSMNQSFSGRSPGAEPAQRSGTAALDLGDLEQVLQDEELARRLQKEEERLAKVTRHGSSPVTRTCPVEDFRIAQVAQDEEIARFMQKEEVKAKRRSHELDPAEPELEHREMLNMYDGRDVQNRQVQRDRLDSQGLQSPIEDFISDRQPPSPIPTTAQLQPIRNIAEELDPTFQRKETTETGQTINGPDQNQVTQQVGLYNPMEETTFVPPTKRQSEKLGRVKPKEKKENAKQKENCKQQ